MSFWRLSSVLAGDKRNESLSAFGSVPRKILADPPDEFRVALSLLREARFSPATSTFALRILSETE